LHRSLASLIHEKRYEDIAVKEILARADIARSTFYAHYDDKEDLLLNSIRQVIAMADDQRSAASGWIDRMLGFSLPVLEHIEAHRRQAPLDASWHGQRQVHLRLERVLTEQVDASIRSAPHGRAMPAMPPELLATHVVTTFLTLVEWWLNCTPAPSAHEAHALYRTLVEPVLAGVGT
jgi:AcrR family transcriptional regulator